MIAITLPMPPSVNEAYAGKAIRYKSKEYKEWEVRADKALRMQADYSIEWDEWLAVEITIYTDLYYQNWKKRVIDCANYEKCPIDFLAGYVERISRKPIGRRYHKLWVQRIPGFEDHKVISNRQVKKQKQWDESFIVVKIKEVKIE